MWYEGRKKNERKYEGKILCIVDVTCEHSKWTNLIFSTRKNDMIFFSAGLWGKEKKRTIFSDETATECVHKLKAKLDSPKRGKIILSKTTIVFRVKIQIQCVPLNTLPDSNICTSCGQKTVDVWSETSGIR